MHILRPKVPKTACRAFPSIMGFPLEMKGSPSLMALFVHDAQTGWRECFPVPAKGGVWNGMNVLQYLASELLQADFFLGLKLDRRVLRNPLVLLCKMSFESCVSSLG